MSDRPVHEHIRELSEALVELSNKVLQNFYDALSAVRNQDEERARAIRLVDDEIDLSEVRLEERCLAFLALQQPVARDLRTIVTIMKINDDLERIGDLAVHIIERMPEIGPEMLDTFDFETMGHHAGDMTLKAIEAFITRDRILADRVVAMDEEIDAMHSAVFKKVARQMKDSDADIDQLIAALSISRYIERMADHATRIAGEVIYLVTGEIARHTDSGYEKLIQSLKD
ncbi:MAG: phosphate signaling complex protein PhoU [Chlorobium sp.]|uniref:phosphate signaling complex protein PhoU n=1 Tax=Chlorobium sp. TaxID=1095 RepID=UPI0025BC59E0|nr:phosphate signaling complex protein PhoU [Chlorobium sp.]MCF8216961.1 phosphate signaling complex protein PhoU [Chlorobium sp.]MCF8271790.1 phosphate signaling complex protein PhoU [Chlorobium sp.]MCF8288178.1 phosphate signaling complex protein PhoU [Chlorobium sp.]MCF8291774.1 phosphate signaling complex protein PhoU [Chlorobium sp.]MCF8385866.1 phosphate signaling complex protein PhoU [Chlorobium sp.]